MNKYLIILAIAVLLICVGLSGCFESEKDKFIGNWEVDRSSIGNPTGDTYVAISELFFYNDDSCKMKLRTGTKGLFGYEVQDSSSRNGNWDIDTSSNKLTLSFTDFIGSYTIICDYRFDSDNLVYLYNFKGTVTIHSSGYYIRI